MRLLWEEEAWEAKRLLSADSSLFVLCIMVKSILRAQSHFHHIGEALLALLCGGDLRGDKAVGDGQQAGGVLAQQPAALANRAKLSISTQRQPRSSRSSSQ